MSQGVAVNLETEIREPVRRRSFLAGVFTVLLLLMTMLSLAGVARADETSYPVRLCSPNYFDGNGYPHYTHSRDVGAGTRVYRKAPNGTISYDAVAPGGFSWTIWDVAIPCASPNGNNAGVSTFGFKFFKDGSGIFEKGEEGGLEFTAPAGEEIQQLGLSGRVLLPNDPYANQGGIANGGARLKMEFLQPAGATSVAIPTRTYERISIGAPVAQHSAKVRLGLVCAPDNTASVCFSGLNQVLQMNNLVLTLGDKTRPTVTIGSTPLTNGSWVKGTQQVTFTARDQQSGLREANVFVDGQLVSSKTYPCATVTGEFTGGFSGTMAKTFKPCPQAPQTETVPIDTTRFGDGIHRVLVCVRDFARWSPYWNDDKQGSASCSDTIPIKIDNTAPSAPEDASAINTRIPRAVNPNDVSWANPGTGDKGSPIHEVRYEIINQAGKEVVSTTVVDNDSDSQDAANMPSADNIEHIPTLLTPISQGEFRLQVRLVDEVGQVGKPSEVPLSYSCDNSGGIPLPQANIAMGIVKRGKSTEQATEFLALDQGEKSTIAGKVRGPGQMPVNGADVCINAKPVVDPQLQLLNTIETNGNGNYSAPLTPGPSRNLLTVFRQGHRETWSDPVRTEVTVKPTLSATLKGGEKKFFKNQKKAFVRSGKVSWFKGFIPGPHNNQVVVVLQGKPANKSDKHYRAFRRYRTRFGGKFQMRNRFYNTSTTGKKAYLKIRAQVRNQVGYPYKEGDSKEMTLVVLPKKKSGKKK